jgi:hypothetical protein
MSAPAAPPLTGTDFYVTGGTLRPDAPSYVERQADRDLCDGLLQGEFCYVLTSRQMGKSSLMVRTVRRLRQDGVTVAVLDLTAIGQNLTISQWYDGLIARLGQQLDLEDELLDFTTAHPELGPLHRWISALEQVVLVRFPGRVVIFIDEIDIVRSLPFSTDEFFAAIRECFNRRSRDPGFSRLAFGLSGVATPTDLIRDTRTTPFNIGRRIELNDFTPEEAEPLARGLGADGKNAQALLSRVLYWTGGHPYLTQRLCRALAETIYQRPSGADPEATAPPVLPTLRTVDELANKLFLSRQARDRDDNLIFVRERLLKSETDVAGLLLLYRKIHGGQLVPDDETSPHVSILRLSGITRGLNGFLQVRNRVYWQVFDLNWIQTNMPAAEVRRQKKAGRRGMLVGLSIALVILLSYLLVRPNWIQYRQARVAARTLADFQAIYRSLESYRDSFETTVEVGLGGVPVTFNGSGSVQFERPNRVHLVTRTSLNKPEIELQSVSDGKRSWLYAPSLGQYMEFDGVPMPTPFDLPPSVARHYGPLRMLPLYHMLLLPPAIEQFSSDVQDLESRGEAELNGEPVHILHWLHRPVTFMVALGFRPPPPDRGPIPVTAWVNSTNHLVVQLAADVSCWASELFGRGPELPVTSVVITERHKNIRVSSEPMAENQFVLAPPAAARLVERVELPPPNYSTFTTAKRQFQQLIPPRLSQAPVNLIDLSDYYNAALAQTWHGGTAHNSLDVLPPGLLQLGGTVFDVRGIVQLSGRGLQRSRPIYPPRIMGIRVGQVCRQLHFLQATGWTTRDGTPLGKYIVHYADGKQQMIPIIYGEDVRDWNASADPSTDLKRSTVVWSATNKAPFHVRLFKTTWLNPMPDTEITSIDFISENSDSAPFLIALTAEQ